jgi:hypothetical protein
LLGWHLLFGNLVLLGMLREYFWSRCWSRRLLIRVEIHFVLVRYDHFRRLHRGAPLIATPPEEVLRQAFGDCSIVSQVVKGTGIRFNCSRY